MKKILKSRQRILGMRETQLRIATGDSAAARGNESSLEQKRTQLKALAVHMHKAGAQCREGRRKSMLSRKPVDHPCLQALTHPRLRLRLRRR